ncbi:MAG: hypothetical protein OXN25_08085 [Candidatus Poribacteria bacterium]|nr:hypothetical protein [Candidatus Poribacteria bacterium]
MKALLKSLTYLIIFSIVIGAGICLYLLQAPPVEQKGVPKLQIHKRTALRGRPTVDSKPIVYTKDVYRFSLDSQYISNLNSRKLARELVFNASLGHRATLKAQRLDTALKTATDWQKMFADLTKDIRFRPSGSPIEVLLSGEEWRLRDASGAAYTIVRTDDTVGVYLPDLKEAFDANKIGLSTDLEISTEERNRHWLIKDNQYKQAYNIRSAEGKLHVYQQSKFEILTFLFETDSVYESSLAAGKLPAKLIQEFVKENMPVSRRAQVSADKDAEGWMISSPPLKYDILSENNRLKVYLNLDSKWLRVKIDGETEGWVQSARGTVFTPPPPTLSSRQQAKERLLVLIDRVKDQIRRANAEN